MNHSFSTQVNVRAWAHIQCGWIVTAVMIGLFTMHISRVVGNLRPEVLDVRCLGALFKMITNVYRLDGFGMIPFIFELLAVTSGYYAVSYYGYLQSRVHNIRPDPYKLRQATFTQNAAVIFHMMATFLLVIIEIYKHRIVFHSYLITRKIFKDEFLQFLPLYKPKDDRRKRLARAKRLGLNKTFSNVKYRNTRETI